MVAVAASGWLPAMAGDSVVVVNEIHYNPVDPALEFVELHNQLSVNVDLSGWRFDGGITFGFSEGTVIPARGYLVVAKNPAALMTATGATGVLGPFTGALANEGETLRLWNNNGALRTLTAPPPPPAASELWSVDLQGDGVGGVYGQVAPTTMSGAESVSGIGGVWNALTIASHPATSTNPGLAVLTDSAGGASQLSFSITGTVSGFTVGAAGGSTPLYNDYMFLNAGNSASNITWQLAGANPAKSYAMWLYGSASRSLRLKVDVNGNGTLTDDAAVTAPANGGVLVSGIRPQASGVIIGNADTPGGETNWSGFQLMIPASGGGGSFDPGTYDTGLERRRLMDEVSYNDRDAWPVGPDGSGYSLAKIDPQAGSQAANWAASAQVNGSPGAANFSEPANPSAGPPVALNEIAGTGDAVFKVELYGYGSTSVDLTGWRLQCSNPVASYVFPSGGVAAGRYLALDEITLGFRPLPGAELFLFSPSRLADAAHMEAAGQGREVPGTGRWLRPASATFGEPNAFSLAGDLVINEIFHTDFTDGDEEWLELKNRGSETVDLTGWRLGGGIGYEFPAGTTLAPGAYLVVARDAAALTAKYPGRPVIGNYTGRLGDEDSIVLEEVNGNPADEVNYHNDAPWPANADRGGSSLELRDTAADNSRPEAWQASLTAQLGTWQTVVYEGVATDDGIGKDAFRDFMLGLLDRGEVLIDDVSVRESPAGANLEFIENGTFQADVIGAVPAGWRCLGNHGQGRTVVVADPADASNKCLRVVATGPTEDKHNRIETTFVGSTRKVVVGRTYRISFRARWLAGSNQVNTRLYFNYLQRTTLLAVGSQWGTPGLANSTAVANAGPTATGLAQQPVVPGGGVPVTVSAAVADPQGVAAVQLYYRVNSGAWQNIAMTLGAVGRHTGTVPGQAAGSLVQFYLRATDGSGAVADYPADGAAGGFFYRVANNDADASGLRANLRILVAPEHETLLFTNTNRMGNDTFPATVIEDERTAYYGCRVRLKGSAFGRYAATEFGYSIDFPADQPFRGVHVSVSIERAGNLKEIIAKHILNRAGGGYWSQYDDVAKINGPGVSGIGLIAASRTTSVFLKSLYPELPTGTVFNHELLYQPNGTVDGGDRSLKLNNPYNHDRGTYELADRGTDPEPYRWGWQIRSQRRDDHYDGIVRLNRAFALTGAAFTAEVEATIDVDQWMRTWALMGLYGNDDQYGRVYAHNWRIYQRPTDGRLIALPWDLDRAFNLGTTDSVKPTGFKILDLFAVPAYQRAFDSHVLDLVRTTCNKDYLAPWITHLGVVTGETGEFSGISGYVAARATYALTTLPASVPFAITTNGGADFTTAASTLTLEGNGWSDIDSIARDGTVLPLPVSWTGPTTWRVTLSLNTGVNAIALTARSPQGVSVGTDLITVTSTAATVAAGALNLVVSELHYNPAGPSPAEIAAGFTSENDFEFLELMNISADQKVNLTNVTFDAGISFGFTVPTLIPPGGRVVLPRRTAAFAMRHPGIAVVGEYFEPAGPTGNQLSNGGERVTLRAADGQIIKSFVYDDATPWPTEPDGAGRSLVLIHPLANPEHSDPLNWRASVATNGNPGSSDALPPFAGDPVADADLNGRADLLDYAFGTGASPGIAPNGNGGLFYAIDRNPLAEVGLTIERSSELVPGSWQVVADGDLVSRATVAKSLERLVFSVPPVGGQSNRLFLRVRVAGD